MAELTATIQLKTGMTLDDFIGETGGIPGDAVISTYHYNAGNDPREYDYTNLIFTWRGHPGGGRDAV
jgi:hypothetical protein